MIHLATWYRDEMGKRTEFSSTAVCDFPCSLYSNNYIKTTLILCKYLELTFSRGGRHGVREEEILCISCRTYHLFNELFPPPLFIRLTFLCQRALSVLTSRSVYRTGLVSFKAPYISLECTWQIAYSLASLSWMHATELTCCITPNSFPSVKRFNWFPFPVEYSINPLRTTEK